MSRAPDELSMSASDDLADALSATTSRLQQALMRLQQALEAQTAQTTKSNDLAIELEEVRRECLKLRSENESLKKQAAQAEEHRVALESKNLAAANRIEDVIGQLRNVLAH